MSMILTEVALQRLIQIGLKNLRDNPAAFRDIFAQYKSPAMAASYGDVYIDKIVEWFNTTKLPIVQSWSFDPQRVPAISIHLADESEDESKAGISDFFGDDEHGEILTGPATVSLDIGIHADKTKDVVLWMYYIVVYILYKEKMTGRSLGLQLYTYRANEYNKESKYMADNVWSRWVRFKCTVQHYVDGEVSTDSSLALDIQAESVNSGNDIVNISSIIIEDDE